ncbi:S6 family peptidase, partial [Erwinia mallotivora]|uniref:S6 family peptidase n=1 Tax=Erwinia mallotivora TaxID=69222 RepID=UPI0035ED1E73
PEFIANLPFTACHTLPSEIIVMHYTITPFGMSSYKLINRNNHSSLDFHIPRLNKVVTDATPVAIIGKSDFLSNYKSRYRWYTRVGAGAQTQVNEEETKRVSLAAAYKWKTGGTISTENLRSISSGSHLRYYNLGPDSAFTTPLSIGTGGGDSGSPVFAWDEVDEQWKLVAVHRGYDLDNGVYQKRAIAVYIPQDFVASTQASHTSATSPTAVKVM